MMAVRKHPIFKNLFRRRGDADAMDERGGRELIKEVFLGCHQANEVERTNLE